MMLTLIPISASALVDEDFDGMSDLCEELYSFSITDDGTLVPSQAPISDPDGDGANNLNESVAGPIHCGVMVRMACSGPLYLPVLLTQLLSI